MMEVSELLILGWIILGTAVFELLMSLLPRQDCRSFCHSELEELLPSLLS
jgi:hypothetical protein